MDLQEVLNFILEKLKEALHGLENLGHQILAWFDHIFPPETRGDNISHWIHVALPYLIAALVFIAVVCLWPCCCRCCYSLWRCCCRCCCGPGRVKMMRAPGRNCMMPRRTFENDPRGYFQGLRSHPGDQLC